MTGSSPAPFTADDYRARMRRAARAATDAGLAGLLVAPGPDLVWLTGYAPPRSPNASPCWCWPPDRTPSSWSPHWRPRTPYGRPARPR